MSRAYQVDFWVNKMTREEKSIWITEFSSNTEDWDCWSEKFRQRMTEGFTYIIDWCWSKRRSQQGANTSSIPKSSWSTTTNRNKIRELLHMKEEAFENLIHLVDHKSTTEKNRCQLSFSLEVFNQQVCDKIGIIIVCLKNAIQKFKTQEFGKCTRSFNHRIWRHP